MPIAWSESIVYSSTNGLFSSRIILSSWHDPCYDTDGRAPAKLILFLPTCTIISQPVHSVCPMGYLHAEHWEGRRLELRLNLHRFFVCEMGIICMRHCRGLDPDHHALTLLQVQLCQSITHCHCNPGYTEQYTTR